MGDKTGAILKELKNSALQNSMRFDFGTTQSLDVNFGMAKSFYDFLVKKSNKLPIDEYIDRVVDKYSNKFESSSLISVGCGLNVFYVNSGEKGLLSEIETPISPSKLRIDKISCNEHSAYIISTSDANVFYNEIDVEKEPLFLPSRVKTFQNYLKQYSLRHSEIDEMFSGTNSVDLTDSITK